MFFSVHGVFVIEQFFSSPTFRDVNGHIEASCASQSMHVLLVFHFRWSRELIRVVCANARLDVQTNCSTEDCAISRLELVG